MRLFLENFIQPGLRLRSPQGHTEITVLASLDHPTEAWVYDKSIEEVLICLVQVYTKMEADQVSTGAKAGDWKTFYVVGGFKLEDGIGNRQVPRTNFILLPWYDPYTYWFEDIGPATKQLDRCLKYPNYHHTLDFARALEPTV